MGKKKSWSVFITWTKNCPDSKKESEPEDRNRLLFTVRTVLHVHFLFFYTT